MIRRAVARVAPGGHSRGVRVLLYHAVDEPIAADGLALRVSRAAFAQQMRLLATGRYRVVPLHAVVESALADDRPRVAITFDDGYRSMTWAADVLQEYGFPATFFVVAAFADGVPAPRAYWETWGHLPWADLAALLQAGFEVGAHSMTHRDLTQCDDWQLQDEVHGAKALLESRLGMPVTSFSYPFGRHNRRVRAMVERAGYRLACSSDHGCNAVAPPKYVIRRTEVSGTDTAADFQAKLEGRYDWLRFWRHLTS